jgi:molybdopterin adenylyltransferase
MANQEAVCIGILTISDRASRGQYEDESGPAIEAWLRNAVHSPWTPVRLTVPDGIEPVRAAMTSLCDQERADLVLSTGGTGPAPRDVTPEAMREVIDRELPGFGELMRKISLRSVPTAILSRQSAGIRGQTLIVTLPGRPASIATCLNAVFPAIPYCLDLIGARRIETNPDVCQAFRPV